MPSHNLNILDDDYFSHCKYSERRLMGSQLMLSAAYCISKVPFTIHYYMKITGYCYHSVNGIRYGLAQSDPIKRRLLYSMHVINM